MTVTRSLSRVETAYLEIKNRIMSGEYAPGAPLSESALSRVMEASRTPIREALCRLLEEGYVERFHGRGFHVSRITVQVLQDTFEVRRLLEGTAARRAAELVKPATIMRLRELAPMIVPGRSSEQANTLFHMAVAEASGNALLVDLVQHCLSQIARVMAGTPRASQPVLARGTQEHQAIVDAIAQGDSEAAARAMQAHLDDCSHQFMQTLVRGELRNIAI
jgi:DNA-binding GntR family transcriptional regulator